MKLQIKSQEVQAWPADVQAHWDKRVASRFKNGETCSQANYFEPRPRVDEYNRGSLYAGFCYTVQPGNHVCIVEWIP